MSILYDADLDDLEIKAGYLKPVLLNRQTFIDLVADARELNRLEDATESELSEALENATRLENDLEEKTNELEELKIMVAEADKFLMFCDLTVEKIFNLDNQEDEPLKTRTRKRK